MFVCPRKTSYWAKAGASKFLTGTPRDLGEFITACGQLVKPKKRLELMVKALCHPHVAFGKPIAKLGKNLEVISRARIEINAMRLAVLAGRESNGCTGQ